MASRRTQARVAIASELLANGDSVVWGYELSRNAGVGAGSMYPFLKELLDREYLTDGWEDADQAATDRPRRYYRLTPEGKAYLRQFLEAAPPARRASARGIGRVRPVIER